MSAYGLLGSGEFEPWSADVDRRLLADATGDGRVLILPTASAKEGDTIFDGWGSMGLEHFDSIGIPAEVVPIKTREDAGRPGFVAKVTEASVVLYQMTTPPCSMLWTRNSLPTGWLKTRNGAAEAACGPEVGGLLG